MIYILYNIIILKLFVLFYMICNYITMTVIYMTVICNIILFIYLNQQFIIQSIVANYNNYNITTYIRIKEKKERRKRTEEKKKKYTKL